MSETAIKVKAALVDEIVEKLENSKSVIFIDYKGLTVDQDTGLRNEFRKNDVEYKVIKNKLLERATDKLGIDDIKPVFNGPTAVAFSYSDEIAAAKVLSKFAKDSGKTEIKAGLLGKKVIDKNGVESLAKLPSKEILIATVMGTMNAPITGFVSATSGIIRNFMYALNAVVDQKQANA